MWYRRHEIIRGFFIQVLALDEKLADANACRMEHVLDPEVLERLAAFANFVSGCPGTRKECLAGFKKYLADNKKNEKARAETAAPKNGSKKAVIFLPDSFDCRTIDVVVAGS